MNNITPIILYLQEFVVNEIMTYIINSLIYNRSQAILCLEIFLKLLQDLTYGPIAILYLRDIKATNQFFYQLLLLIPNETVFTTELIMNLLDTLLQPLRAATPNNFTSKYQAFPYDPYLLQTSSYYYIVTTCYHLDVSH